MFDELLDHFVEVGFAEVIFECDEGRAIISKNDNNGFRWICEHDYILTLNNRQRFQRLREFVAIAKFSNDLELKTFIKMNFASREINKALKIVNSISSN